MADVRAELGRVYRESRAGRIAPADLTRFAYTLRQIGDLISLTELENRIAQLEDGNP